MRWRSLPLPLAAALGAFALFAGTAHAAVPSGDTINKSAKPKTTWQGQVYALGVTSDPTMCGSAAADPGNIDCDHFQLTTQDAGTVGVIVQWPDLTPDISADNNDFDLLICVDTIVDTTNDNCTGGNQVAYTATQNPSFETATFNAVAGTTYDVRVIPFFVIASDYQGCAAYTSAQNACPQPVPSGTSQGGTPTSTCPTGGVVGDRRINGGGRIGNSTTPTDEHFSLEVSRKGTTPDIDGKVNWKSDTNGATQTLQFKSTKIDCVTFYDEGTDTNNKPKGSAEIRGKGKFKDSKKIAETTQCFRAFARDAGEPGPGIDQFDIDFVDPQPDGSCVFSAAPVGRPISEGNIDYKLKA